MAVSFVGNQMQGIYQCLPHSHPEWEILFNLDGEGDLVIGDRRYKFTPGSVFCQPPGVPHYKTSSTPFNDLFIRVDDPRLPNTGEILHTCDDAGHSLENLFSLALRTYYNKSENSRGIVDAVYETIYQILLGSLSETQTRNELIERIKNSLIANFPSPDFKARDAARESAYSYEHLRRLFKAATGASPQEFLNNLRIEYACRLLHSGGDPLPIAEVAYACGFADPLYFSRYFRLKTGMSPRQYAAQNGLETAAALDNPW